jgi:hypothetical protein
LYLGFPIKPCKPILMSSSSSTRSSRSPRRWRSSRSSKSPRRRRSSRSSRSPKRFVVNSSGEIYEQQNNEKSVEIQTEEKEITIDKQSTCCICTDKPPCMACLPCGHLCLCYNCSIDFATLNQKSCPICRNQFETIKRIFVC